MDVVHVLRVFRLIAWRFEGEFGGVHDEAGVVEERNGSSEAHRGGVGCGRPVAFHVDVDIRLEK